ncbi:MAG: MmgE/PrpD family protein [Proteobacteria bacterium]|nr:MmgE/PrpD family protein [Burkholderiales bacterium]
MNEPISLALGRFAAALDYDAIPCRVRECARMHLLDTIGVAYASASFEFAQRALHGLTGFGVGAHAVIGMRGRLELRDAVLMNGILAHGLDYDDTSIFGRVHPSASTVPCVLGLASHLRVSGKALIAAYVAGIECAIRIGGAAAGGFQRCGFHPTGVVGAFGCAIAASHLLRLTAEQTAMAQGIVYSAAAGNQEFTTEDAWTKRFHAGWAAVSGMSAAMLARGGFVGPLRPYEGRFGLYRTYLDQPVAAGELARLVGTLGRWWTFEQVALKPVPACHFLHAIIHSTIEAVTRGGLAPDDIASIHALVPRAAIDTVCEPRAAKLAPVDTYGAQFSVYYAAACAAVQRRFTLADVEAPVLTDPRIRALAARVDYAEDPLSNFPQHYSGGVVVRTVDGREFAAREDINRGSPERPMMAAEIQQKFLANAARVVPAPRAQALLDGMLDIDAVEDVGAFTSRLGLNEER